jgi:protein-disulfide isomerase/uncharacterized membrane protein
MLKTVTWIGCSAAPKFNAKQEDLTTMTETKRDASPIYMLLSILSAVGAALAIWQTRLFFVTRSGMGELHSFCNIGQTFDCTAIEMSKYSEFIGGFPLSGFAIAGYLTILVLSLMGLGSHSFRKNVRGLLIFFTGIAVLFSLAYLVIMLTVIGKLCILCLTVDIINVALLIISLRLPKSEETPGAGGVNFGHLAGVGIGSLLVAFLFAKGLDPQSEMKKDDLNDLMESVMNTPSIPVDYPADSPVVGDPNGKVLVVKFSDYECPACKMGASAIHPLFKRYPSGVKFVFVNYPLDQACNPNIPRKMHEFACEAANVAICGGIQGKFLDTYETLFDHQKDFETGKIADLLAHVPGIDLAKLKECIKLPSTADKLRRDIVSGGKDKMNIQSTPTFFVNGKKVEGGLPTNLWVEIIDRLLK